jgi:hypothetical protein
MGELNISKWFGLALALAALAVCACAPASSVSAIPGALGTPSPAPTPTPQAGGGGRPPANITCTASDPLVAVPNAPHGLFVWSPNNRPAIASEVTQYIIGDPTVCGASLSVDWAMVDKGPTSSPQYDFSVPDAAASPWIAAGKTVNFLVKGEQETGNTPATPAYVLNNPGLPKISCPGAPVTPQYWNPIYMGPYQAFISAFLAHYSGKPNIGYIRFGIGTGAESHPQNSWENDPCPSLWTAAGISEPVWTNYSTTMVDYMATHNPGSTQLMVSINPYALATGSQATEPLAVAQHAAAGRVGFGTQNLDAGGYVSPPGVCTQSNTVYWCTSFTTYAGQVPLEFQPITASLATQGNGTTVTASVDVLLQYGIANRTQIFELYPEEWLVANDPAWPNYGQYHCKYQQALQAAASSLGSFYPTPAPCST